MDSDIRQPETTPRSKVNIGATDTRTRILIGALALFNEAGEPNTTTNDIANEVDISPGNLHYHFRKKSNLLDALLIEFRADARRTIALPEDNEDTFDDFWIFLHLLLEFLLVYRFVLRDVESLSTAYPKFATNMRKFSKGLAANIQIRIRLLATNDVLHIGESDIAPLSRNIAVVLLFSQRFDEIVGVNQNSEETILATAKSVLTMLLPYSEEDGGIHIQNLTREYGY